MNKLLYGVASYYEYLPYDRPDEDIKMMKADTKLNVKYNIIEIWIHLAIQSYIQNIYI